VTSFAPSCPAAFEVVVRSQGPGDVALVVLLALRWIGNLIAASLRVHGSEGVRRTAAPGEVGAVSEHPGEGGDLSTVFVPWGWSPSNGFRGNQRWRAIRVPLPLVKLRAPTVAHGP
jgi:hypothetical protein